MKTCARCWFYLAVFSFFFSGHGLAPGTREGYQRAEEFLAGNLRHHIYVAEAAPHWIAKKNRFWCRNAGTRGAEFLLVDAEQNTAGPAFDHPRRSRSPRAARPLRT
jgi:hypothetical protein